MCYDISFATSAETIIDYLPHLRVEGQIEFKFDSIHVIAHAFPKYPITVFENGGYVLKQMEWGLIANYMDTAEKIKKGRNFMLNARSEGILDKAKYWHRIRNQRCLIPVTGIYEHREVEGLKNKIPYHVEIKGRNLFLLPGLYNYSPVPDPETGEMKPTFALITRNANPLMAQIHNGGENKFRMPLFLSHDLELKWLKPDLTDTEIKEIIDYEIPSEQLKYTTVYSIRGRTPRPDGLPKNAHYEYENLPQLEYEKN